MLPNEHLQSAGADPSHSTFDALGNPVRRQLLALIGERPQSVAEIARHFDISRPAISRHLAILARAGFVAPVRHGTRNIYRINSAGFEAGHAWLNDFWNEAEARLRLLAENLSEEAP